MEYLSNCLLDHTQILNLDLVDQSKVFKYFKWRQPPMEDNLKIWKIVYLSNHWLDHTNILNWSLYDQIIFCQSFKWRCPLMEDDLKILKVQYLSNHLLDPTQITNSRGNKRKTQRTSRVWLCSAQLVCFICLGLKRINCFLIEKAFSTIGFKTIFTTVDISSVQRANTNETSLIF